MTTTARRRKDGISLSTTTAAAQSRPELRASGTTLVNVIRSEWTKLWSVRSTMWTILATMLVTWATLVALVNYLRRGVPATWEFAEDTRV